MSSIAVSSWDYYFKYWTHVDLHLYMWGGQPDLVSASVLCH